MQFIDVGHMYSNVEVDENANENFLSALALLHSSDDGSAERLKNMLNDSIDKKLGKTFGREATNVSRNYSVELTGIVREFEDQVKLMEISRGDEDSSDRTSSFSSNETTVDYNSLPSSEICTTDDSFEDEAIPRISIPDETTPSDAIFRCKICNGDKLGPLILLECHDCQDFYHPLCHQPPVVDVDVYDPRIVWRCGKCVETTSSSGDRATTAAAPSIVTLDDRADARGEKKKYSGSRTFGSSNTSSSLVERKIRNNELTELSYFRRTRTRLENHGNCVKRISGLSNKNSSVSLRKRVGSRLGVTRGSSAK